MAGENVVRVGSRKPTCGVLFEKENPSAWIPNPYRVLKVNFFFKIKVIII